jgi:hypothetical protein
MNDPMLDTWNTHHRIVLFLLDAIDSEGLKSTRRAGAAPRKCWPIYTTPGWRG